MLCLKVRARNVLLARHRHGFPLSFGERGFRAVVRFVRRRRRTLAGAVMRVGLVSCIGVIIVRALFGVSVR